MTTTTAVKISSATKTIVHHGPARQLKPLIKTSKSISSEIMGVLFLLSHVAKIQIAVMAAHAYPTQRRVPAKEAALQPSFSR